MAKLRAGEGVLTASVGLFAAPLNGRDAGFFMFVALVSIFCWVTVIITTILRHGAKHIYRKTKSKRNETVDV
ncbi:MAG TPA: hypothetical protein VLF60_02705 [Candidatus Saccharimonadales bacterium]|nr:hypothetical protein [Candidatus Saccharimonadales bacterium]